MTTTHDARAPRAPHAAAKASPLVALASRCDLEGTVTGFQPLSEGLMNRDYRITTSAGDWFLKRYLDAGPRQIARQHQVTIALAGMGLLYQEQAEQPVAILDWDRLGARPCTTEMVRAATLLFGYNDERGLDLARVELFLDAYRQAFPWLAAGGEIRSAVHQLWWERRYQHDDRTCDHLFAGAAALVAWWIDHDTLVLDAFATSSCPRRSGP